MPRSSLRGDYQGHIALKKLGRTSASRILDDFGGQRSCLIACFLGCGLIHISSSHPFKIVASTLDSSGPILPAHLEKRRLLTEGLDLRQRLHRGYTPPLE